MILSVLITWALAVCARGGGGAGDRKQYQIRKSLLPVTAERVNIPCVYTLLLFLSSFFHILSFSNLSLHLFFTSIVPCSSSPHLLLFHISVLYFPPSPPPFSSTLPLPPKPCTSFLSHLFLPLHASSVLPTSQHPHGDTGLCSHWVHGCCRSEDATTNCPRL